VARKKTPKIRVNVKASLSRRLREIREELFGVHGGPELARRLNLPARTWYNYETGVSVPYDVLLSFIELAGVNPMYLLSGEGERYRRRIDEQLISQLSPVELIRRGLEKLEAVASEENLSSDYAAVSLYPLDWIGNPALDAADVEGHIMAYRPWLTDPSRTIAVRMTDDAMHPILPAGSIAAIDRSKINPTQLHGRIVAACPQGKPMIRWLDVSGRHMILRPNVPSREFPLISLAIDEDTPSAIIGQVVWSWSRFSED
jgi:SOS-response transcriptional repressor LexA